jgi:hypothetical protein
MLAVVTCLPLRLARADQKVRLAYISDSSGSSAPCWIANEAGLYKRLDVELIFIIVSTRGVHSLAPPDTHFTSAADTSVNNGKLASGVLSSSQTGYTVASGLWKGRINTSIFKRRRDGFRRSSALDDL